MNGTNHAPAGEINTNCTECLRCAADCEFLKKHGTPKRIAARAAGGEEGAGAIAFECSLCRLCDAVCPEGLSPSDMFLSLRQVHLAAHPGHLRKYAGLLRFERLGSSALLSHYAIPAGCDTVFFPGCNLPGTRPKVTERLFRELSSRLPRLGLVLDCCNKPSRDLGRADFFREEFGRKLERLAASGVKTVITGCPNCYDVFSRHGGDLRVFSVYEAMAEQGPGLPRVAAEFLVHDPCALRYNQNVTGAVRKLLSDAGAPFGDMKHSGRKTYCCGEGGAVERANPKLSDAWREKIRRESGGRRVITSCGGCQRRLSDAMPALHLLDLWFDPEKALAGKARIGRMPVTYLNRFLLRRRMRRLIGGMK